MPLSSISESEITVIDSGEDLRNFYRTKFLILKKDENFSVLRILANEHKFVMPWHSFWDPAWLCTEIILDNNLIVCGDSDMPEKYKSNWAWDRNGINKASDLSDLDVVPYQIEGMGLTIGKH